ncbi:CYTH domain-containing protein [Curvivirga aplysinae]|uniref:CYTH domain-containing protein n=1 Tax=Curvivirga aplysinae TaxID=2529852 RepID=UPI0012BD1D9C|nr:CYTH domain-containing protein [Curvivirga aplysinae]MTI10532.1 CYTH domain-containing protein [Curvivirga aplysinae]
MGVEIEVKLEFTPQELRRFRKWSVLKNITNGRPRRSCLRACYYDTDDWDLVNQKSSLRIRREFGDWIQTYKLALPSSEIRRRIELNWTLKEPKLDFGLLVKDENARQASKGFENKKIVEIFYTRIWRTVRKIKYKNSEIELAIDAGHIFAQDKKLEVSEVELELICGEADDLMELALCWQQLFDFKIGGESKAERGYKLAA